MNNDKELEYKIRNIIDTYIHILEGYEQSFRKDLSKRLGVSESRLYVLPMDMYYVVGDLQNEYWLHNIFMGEDNKYAQEYYDKTLKSFQDSGKTLTDSTENGVIFEALLLQALKDVKPMTINETSNLLPVIKTQFDFEGVGFQKKHGDIAFTIRGMKIPILIDAKYSTDRSQIISRTGENFNDINDLREQIVQEIHRGLSKSISFEGDDTWIRKYIQAKKAKEAGDISTANKLYQMGKNQPKILIYIFKDKGMWSSQVVMDLEDRVIENAMVISGKNNRTAIGKAFNKDWLWYGNLSKKFF